MFPDLFAIEVVANQTVTAKEHKQPLAIARGSGRRRAADGMRLFDACGYDGASPKRLPGLLVDGNRDQLLRRGAVARQKNPATVQDGRGVSGIQRHPPTQLPGCIKPARQRSGAWAGNSLGGTEIRRLCRRCNRCSACCNGAQHGKQQVLQKPRHSRDEFQGVVLHESFSDDEAVAPKHNQQLFPGLGSGGFLRLGEPGGCLFLFSFPFRFPITRLSFAVPLSLDFALDRITADLAIVFGGELVPLDLTGHLEGNLIPLELAF